MAVEYGKSIVSMEYNKAPFDDRTANQKRLDTLIEQNKEMIKELKEVNRGQSIMAKAMLAVSEQLTAKKGKKAVDKV